MCVRTRARGYVCIVHAFPKRERVLRKRLHIGGQDQKRVIKNYRRVFIVLRVSPSTVFEN